MECELCENGTGGELHVHSRCHFTAPLRATIEGTKLTLRCYIPSCDKVVAVFEVKARMEAA